MFQSVETIQCEVYITLFCLLKNKKNKRKITLKTRTSFFVFKTRTTAPAIPMCDTPFPAPPPSD